MSGTFLWKTGLFHLDALFYSQLVCIINRNNYELTRMRGTSKRRYEINTPVLVHICIVGQEQIFFVDWQTDNNWTNLGQDGQILSDEGEDINEVLRILRTILYREKGYQRN